MELFKYEIYVEDCFLHSSETWYEDEEEAHEEALADIEFYVDQYGEESRERYSYKIISKEVD